MNLSCKNSYYDQCKMSILLESKVTLKFVLQFKLFFSAFMKAYFITIGSLTIKTHNGFLHVPSYTLMQSQLHVCLFEKKGIEIGYSFYTNVPALNKIYFVLNLC